MSEALVSGRVVRSASERIALRIHLRSLIVGTLLGVATLVVGALGMTSGDYHVPVLDVLRSLAGHGTADTDFIVLDLRLPRLVTGIAVGGALGVSGALVQTITRNPLGSPDFIGLTMGSASGALVAILLLGGGTQAAGIGALAGCLGTALLVYALAYSRGAQGYRLILIGIGVSAMLQALNNFLLARARLEEASDAQLWLIGSLNGRGWSEALPVVIALAILLPLAVLGGRRLDLITLGDELAIAQGVRVERSRAALLGIAVLLVAAATSAAGPVSFVALTAPQLARRLTRSGGAGLVPAAAMGALLVVASDWIAQRVVVANVGPLPVGVMTGGIGGGYLIWLLLHEWRRRRV